MAITLVGIRTAATSDAGATSLTVPMPDGTGTDLSAVEAGDVAVLFAEITQGTAASWSAAGWQVLTSDSGAAAQLAVLLRTLAAADTAVTVAAGVAANGFSLVARVYRGVDPDTPLDVAAAADGSGTASAAVAAAAVTTVTDGAVVVAGYGQTTPGGASYTNWTAPGGMANPGVTCSTVAAVNNAALATWDLTQATAGSTGTLTATSPQSRPWVWATLALRPAPDQPPPPPAGAFPDVPLDVSVELDLPSGWTDITDRVYGGERGTIQLTRGQSADASAADPSTASMELNNRDGRFSARNPLSPYFGQIGRNTRLRVSVDRPDDPDSWLDLTGSPTSTCLVSAPFATPATASLDAAVDIAPRLGIWQGRVALAGRYTTTNAQRSWLFWIEDTTGILGYRWSQDGSAATTVLSTEPFDITADRIVLWVQHQFNGTVAFFTAPTLGGPFTQLGATWAVDPITGLFNTAEPVALGGYREGLARFNGSLYGGLVAHDGTNVASPDFTAAPVGARSVTDDSGATWEFGDGAAVIAPAGIRFTGEVSEWPPRWDPSGRDVSAPIVASGVLRRLQQGTAPLKSTLRRGITGLDGLVAYWPCEDGGDSDTIASALPLGRPMQIIGEPEFSSYDGFAASEPIPTLNDSQWTGPITKYTPTGLTQVRAIISIPADTDTGDHESLLMWTTTGTAATWHLSYRTGGAMGLEPFDENGTSLGDTGSITFNMRGKDSRISVELTETGGDVHWTVSQIDATGVTTGLALTGVFSNMSVGRVRDIRVNNGGGVRDISMGHISVQTVITPLADLTAQLAAYAGETAGRRFLRLCSEVGLYGRVYGDPDDTPNMGPQRPGTLIDLLTEPVASDGGQMFEPADVFGIAMRTRASLYNRAPVAVLDYTAAHLAGAIEPTDDDQYSRNDVTVARSEGSSSRVELGTGPMSTQDPPAGIGRYDDEVTVSLFRDADTLDQAYWRLHLGTVDELRYPALTVDMARAQIAGTPALTAALAALDIGDRIQVDHPPAWLPPDPISQVLLGYTETLGNFERTLALACAPASPYDVAVLDADRYDTSGSYIGFPVVEASKPTAFATAATAHPVLMPDTVNPGDLLLILFASSVATAAATPADWTVLWSLADDGSAAGGYAGFGLVADGTEGGTTVDVTTPVATSAAAIAVRISGAHPDVSTGVAASVATTSDGSLSPDPGKVTPAWGPDTTLWLATAGWENDDEPLTGYPAGYSDGTFVVSGAGTDAGAGVGFAARETVAASEDPGPFAFATSEGWLAITVAVRPAATTVDADATSLRVSTLSGPLWTTDAGDLPFDIEVGGERMTVTAVDGTSSPQTLTVVRSVNGIRKANAAGTNVRLYTPAIRAL